MAFGEASGPPASHSQMRELTELLRAAGHADFRDARGPMGFTQRQASGKFTRDEADEFIAALQQAAHESGTDGPDGTGSESKSDADADAGSRGDATSTGPSAAPAPRPTRPKTTRAKTTQRARAGTSLEAFSDEQLAGELQRRGWVVMEP